MCADVHYRIALRRGWWRTKKISWAEAPAVEDRARQHQTLVSIDGLDFVLFAPNGAPGPKRSQFFLNYSMRINAAGWRPTGTFPSGQLYGIDLRAATIPTVDHSHLLIRANLSGAEFNGVASGNQYFNIVAAHAFFINAYMFGSYFAESNLDHITCINSVFYLATFVNCSLRSASFNDSVMAAARFDSCVLRDANMRSANLANATFSKSDLSGADLTYAILTGARFPECNLEGVKARLADVQSAEITDEQLKTMILE
jgi:uncharacterized protein YjbI with pentapeptide repeats